MAKEHLVAFNVTPDTPPVRWLASLSDGRTVIQDDRPNTPAAWHRLREFLAANPGLASQCTADQIERVVLFLAEKSLSELRRRQEVIESQIRHAHRRAQNESSNRARMLEALEDLQAMHEHVSSAVWRKEFGDEGQHRQ
jgi:hypothetical protein